MQHRCGIKLCVTWYCILDIDIAMKQKLDCFNQVGKLFDKFDFLALPSAQFFPFDKKIQYPSELNNKN